MSDVIVAATGAGVTGASVDAVLFLALVLIVIVAGWQR